MYTKRLVSTSAVIFTIALAFSSCNYAEKQQQRELKQQQYELERARRDSVEKARKDSIAQKEKERELARIAHEDSLAIIAWGDAKFGMSKKEVLRTKAFRGATTKYGNMIPMESDKEYAIKSALGLNNSISVWIDFDGKTENEATRVRISALVNWKDFNGLVNDMKIIIKEFIAKYGEPNDNYRYLDVLSYRDVDKLGKYKRLLIAKWIIGSDTRKNGTKYIELYVSASTTTLYEYNIYIYNTAFPKHPKEKTQQEIQAEKERERKSKEAVENAF